MRRFTRRHTTLRVRTPRNPIDPVGVPSRGRGRGLIRRSVRGGVTGVRREYGRGAAVACAALRQRGPLRRALLAYAQSSLGDSAGYVALLLVAYERWRSPWAITIVLFADYCPRMVLGPLTPRLTSWAGRRTCLVGADVVRALATVTLALCHSFALTAMLALLNGCASAVFRPVAGAALRTLAAGDVSDAVAVRALLATVGEAFGPAVAAAVLELTRPSFLLLCDAVTFAVSAAALASIRLTHLQDDKPQSLSQAQGPLGSMPSRLLATGMAALLAGSMIGVAEPLLIRLVLHLGNGAFGILVASSGCGLAVGAYLAAATRRPARLRGEYRGALALAGGGVLITGLAPTLGIVLAGTAVTGIGNGVALTREEQLLSHLAPSDMLERVLGAREGLQGCALVSAFILGGALAAWLGPRAVFVVSSAGLAMTAAGARITVAAPADRRPTSR